MPMEYRRVMPITPVLHYAAPIVQLDHGAPPFLQHRPRVQDMVAAGVESILVKVACLGLDPTKHLGKTLAQMLPIMMKLQDMYGCNVCGEGGEFETLTLDCPAFKHGRIDLQVGVQHPPASGLVPAASCQQPSACM